MASALAGVTGSPSSLITAPKWSAAFLACASACTTAPLNPAYREDEFAFYLEDLKAKALLVANGSESPAHGCGRAGWHTADPPASARRWTGRIVSSRRHTVGCCAARGCAKPDDVALVLHTSGTTSRPKIVPLSHTNLLTSAANIVRTLKLGPR